ncbi:DUF1093 domain-containing protein [Streptococcus ictaluri]|uniref:YxeA family protein n=1 Tax=Streptococcus ictaluri 707-05 TaxID=764299 RepID=G5JZE1_9STRE|nr:DUF1093 domain-containing protein [Streptococcus ictaluri]EHI70711.1 hypothetical protein STRIC_0651 [Streptococcus ictaluri 707-05]
MKKTIFFFTMIAAIGLAVWGKQYYTDRYVVDDYYYTQIPLDSDNSKDSYLKDKDGKDIKDLPGKVYPLKAFNKEGKEKELEITFRGTKKDYPAPGSYVEVEHSKTIIVGERIISQEKVPQKALQAIKAQSNSAHSH